MRAPFSLGPGGSSVPGVHHTRQIPRRPRRLGPRSIGRNHGCTRSLYKKVFECRTPSLSSLGHEGSSTRTRIVGMITIVVERSPPPIRVEVPFYRLGPSRTRTFSTRAGRLGRRVSHPRELTVRILQNGAYPRGPDLTAAVCRPTWATTPTREAWGPSKEEQYQTRNSTP
jgi:hypothetical protein